MTDNQETNLSSLSIVKDECLANIQQATNHLESFIENRNNNEHLQGCLSHLQQLRGALRIAQLTGADFLAREIITVLQTVPTDAQAAIDNKLITLTSSLFILAHYLDYVQQSGREISVLILPAVNELRSTCRLKPLPDSHFLQLGANSPRARKKARTALFSIESAQRCRHMYQAGLLNILRKQNTKHALSLVHRALEGLDAMCTNPSALADELWAASQAAVVMAENSMDITPARTRLLSALDSIFKDLSLQGEAAYQTKRETSLLREFVYIVAISGSDSESASQLCNEFSVTLPGYTDADVKAGLSELQGPGMSAILSVAESMQEELRNTKNTLEHAMQNEGNIADTYTEMISSLQKVSSVLYMLGLAAPWQSLKSQVEKLQQWEATKHTANTKDLAQTADTLLYVENCVEALKNIRAANTKLVKTDISGMDQLIAHNRLEEAEKVVLNEMQSDWATIMRTLVLYAESAFDKSHITLVREHLNTVRGGMAITRMPRAVKVVEACMRFIDEKLSGENALAPDEKQMEAFADTMTSLEYFSETYRTTHKQNDLILGIAESSVKSLGYPIM